jgi:TolB-like protein
MMKTVVKVVMLTVVLSGCTISKTPPVQSKDDKTNIVKRDVVGPTNPDSFFQNNFQEKQLPARTKSRKHSTINHYARGMMQSLANNMQYVNDKTPVAVASFVYLDDKLDNATLIGNQLSEAFMHELYQYGLPVVDFKSTDYIRVTPEGDFIFSRDYLELSEQVNIQYVLSGTMVQVENGALINVRMIGVKSKAVVGTTQGFIPKFVLDNIGNAHTTDGIIIQQVSN